MFVYVTPHASVSRISLLNLGRRKVIPNAAIEKQKLSFPG